MAQSSVNNGVNNGVNVQALLDAREALRNAPAAAEFTWRASCKWQNGTHAHSTVRGFRGLGLTAGVATVAQNRGIQLRSVEAKLEGKMNLYGILGIDSNVRNGYDDIKVTFQIDADASQQDIEALVAQSQKRSAVYDIVTNPTNVTVEVVKR